MAKKSDRLLVCGGVGAGGGGVLVVVIVLLGKGGCVPGDF